MTSEDQNGLSFSKAKLSIECVSNVGVCFVSPVALRHRNKDPECSFLNGFLGLREKLAPTLVLDLALLAPRRKVGAYASFKKLASEPFQHPVDVFCLFVLLSGNILPDIAGS
jgi:hypothetical protein